MKKYFLFFFILLCLKNFSQEMIVVEYELHKNVNLDKAISSMGAGYKVPDFLKKELEEKFMEVQSYSLVLNQTESTFDWIEKINNSQDDGFLSGISLGDTGLIYKNFETQTYQWETGISNENYIVNDSLKIYDWKILKEKKEILGYEVRHAEAAIDSITTLEAWYAPKLAYKNGPGYFGGLPGLILEVTETKNSEKSGNRSKTYIAVSIKTDKKKKIRQPQKGRLISKAEYEALVQESRANRGERFDYGVDKD